MRLAGLQRAQTWVKEAGAPLRPTVNKGTVDTKVYPRTYISGSCVHLSQNVALVEYFPKGYPQLACFLDSDDAFMIYRRFGILHARVLLRKQDILRDLEEKLFRSDLRDKTTEDGRLCLQSREEEDDREKYEPDTSPKNQILRDIERHLREYGMLCS